MNVGFIGAGNMGGALARAISQHSQTNIYIYDTNREKADTLAQETCGRYAELSELISISDFIFLGVKPQVLPEVLKSISGGIGKGAVLVSMAAGIPILSIEKELNTPVPVIRIMPNTPVNVGEGVTAFCLNEHTCSEKKSSFLSIMAYTGSLYEVDEDEIDAFCAIAGCGPAYAYMFIDALSKAGVSLGLSEDKALAYAAGMVRGATRMVLESEDSPEALREKVCSKGGATIEGVKVLWEKSFESTVGEAIDAAYKRTRELGGK